MPLSFRACCFAALLGLAAGCSKNAGHDHAAAGGHAHTAPHGGQLVPLGTHAYNLEFVREPGAGKLIAYVLDGHAENFVRIQAPSFAVLATVGGEKLSLLLQATGNPATGETVGDTAQFEAQAEWLKTAAAIDGVVGALDIRGNKFENVAFHLPPLAAKP